MGKSITPVGVSPAQQASLSSPSTTAPESEDEQAPAPKKRASGLDLLRLAKVSKSKPGHLPSYKTGDPRYVHQLFISTREEALALYLEFYLLVQFYQRGDATPECSRHTRSVTAALIWPSTSCMRSSSVPISMTAEIWVKAARIFSDKLCKWNQLRMQNLLEDRV
jgi:hypothetical protein